MSMSTGMARKNASAPSSAARSARWRSMANAMPSASPSRAEANLFGIYAT